MANPLQQVLQRQAMQDHLDEKITTTLRPAFSHLCMYVGLVAYTFAGAKVSGGGYMVGFFPITFIARQCLSEQKRMAFR